MRISDWSSDVCSSDLRLSLYQTLLAAESPDIDVFQIDVVWPGSLASHLVDLRDYIPAEALEDHFQQLIANNTVDDQLVAVPWFVDAGLLYYRRDLLEKHGKTVPKTWRDLTETTRAIVAAEQAAGAGDERKSTRLTSSHYCA